MTSFSCFVRLYALAVLLLLSGALGAAPASSTASADGNARPVGTAGAPVLAPPAPSSATDTPRIGVVTMQPGQEFWSRFGHDALVVLDPASGQATSYNFGFFDPTEPDFVQRFLRNDMRYRLVALPFEQDMQQYAFEGRGVRLQWLNLTPEQARGLAEALRVNAQPENAFYRYQYFDDNCAIRVRDAIDRTLGGALRRQTEGRSHGNTLRSEALRLSSPEPWMWAALDLVMGPDADRPIPVWGESYVPGRLADALDAVKNTQGEPLVSGGRELLPHTLQPEPAGAPMPWWPWALVGLVLGASLAWIGDRSPRVLALAALPLWSLFGLVGVVLAYAWLQTGHTISIGNRNLLLFNPLCLLLLPGGVQALRGRPAGRLFVGLTAAVALAALAALFLYWLPVYPQRHAHWIALSLPVHAGLWFGFRRAARLRLA